MSTTGSELAVPVQGVVITPAERASSATALAEAGSIHSWLIVMKDVTLLAEYICDTAFVPRAIRGNAPAVAAAILAGMELNLQPMTALRHVQIVEGSPGLSAEYKRARVLAAGHKLDITEHTTEACTVTGHRKGHEPVTVRYTIQDARRAGLVESKPGHGPRPYVTRPRRMLFARACTEVCDALFTDLTNGLPTADLMGDDGDGDEFGGYNEQPAAPQRQRVTAEQARARTVTATVVTPEPSPAGPDASPSSAPSAPRPPADVPPAGEATHLKTGAEYIAERLEKLGVTGIARTAGRLAGRQLADLDDLTDAEAVTVMRTLSTCTTPADLDGVLAELEMASDPRGEVPGGE